MFGMTKTSRAVRTRVAVAGVVGILTATICAAPADAADRAPGYSFVTSAGGTKITAADGGVLSPLTADAGFRSDFLTTTRNSAGDRTLEGAVHVATVETSASATAVDGGYRVRSKTFVEGLSVLGGAVSAREVATTATARVVDGVLAHSVSVSFDGLEVAGRPVPNPVARNTRIRIGRKAVVVLDAVATSTTTQRAAGRATGVVIHLLEPFGDLPAGATIAVAPSFSSLRIETTRSGHVLYGHAFGTRVRNAQLVTGSPVDTDETAPVTADPSGDGGTAQVDRADLGLVSTVGTVTDSAGGKNNSTTANVRASSAVSEISLLGGRIRADEVSSTARATWAATDENPMVRGSTTFENLVIGGEPVPAHVTPNTRMSLGKFAVVILRRQQRPNAHALVVYALDIRFTRAFDGFPRGAEIQIGAARVAVS
jgi:hypothetical protein